jgi:hypothetical protein
MINAFSAKVILVSWLHRREYMESAPQVQVVVNRPRHVIVVGVSDYTHKGNGPRLRVAFRSESGDISSSHVLGSRNSLALNDGVYGISVDWPRTPNFQQPLNYRRMPRSVDGIPSGHHVYTARKAAPKASFCCSFHRSIPAALGRFSSKSETGTTTDGLKISLRSPTPR